MNLDKIAVFDSGVGGLGTLKLLKDAKIFKEIVYYADNKNVPFGDKSKEEILKIGQNALDYLSSLDVSLIILACNTVSSILPKLKCDKLVYPISDFAIKGLEQIKNNQNTLVVATKATINSGLYQNACKIHKINSDFISPIAFVPVVESMDFSKANSYFAEYFSKNNYDYILYACTHYPFLDNEFNNYFKNSTKIDPAKILQKYLIDKYFIKEFDTKIDFRASGDVELLKKFYKRIENA